MKKKTRNDNNIDIEYVFYDNKIDIVTEKDVDASIVAKVEEIIEHVSKEVHIDSSYVNFDDNKHLDVFVEQDGWDKLHRLMFLTDFCDTATDREKEIIFSAFEMMILGYMYTVLTNMGYDQYLDKIYLDMRLNKKQKVDFLFHKQKGYLDYPGRWQDWPIDKFFK